jgi:hypothetical protein
MKDQKDSEIQIKGEKEEFEQGNECFNAFVRHACDMARETPETPIPWRSSTWEFTRLCKGHPRLNGLSATEVFQTIDWSFTNFDEEEQIQFFAEWDKVLFDAQQNPLSHAVQLAIDRPLRTELNLKHYSRFISVAGWLQVMVGKDAEIYLPIESVASYLRVSASTVSNMRRIAEKDGLIKKTADATAKRATRYRFDLSRYPELASSLK